MRKLPFALKIPIVQAPMAGGHTTPELVAAVSNAGGLGSLGCGYMEPEAIRHAIQKVRQLTSSLFNVNLFAPSTAISPSDTELMEKVLAEIWSELNDEPFEVPTLQLPSFEKQVAVLLEEKVPIFSFTFGIPPDAILQEFRDLGTSILGTATTPQEAQKLAHAGVSAIVVQGKEAGGHRGNFSEQDPLFPLSELLQLTKKEVELPLIAAGGIMNSLAIAKVLKCGASAAQLGTAFLTTRESGSPPAYKEALLQKGDTPTVITKAFTGKCARALVNTFIEKVEKYAIPPYPLQHFLTQKIRALATQLGRSDLMAIWAGEKHAQCQNLTANDLIKTLFDNSYIN